MDEYPKALYRDGTEFEWEGLSLDMLVVDDADAEAAARKDGWASAGEEAPKPRRKQASGD